MKRKITLIFLIIGLIIVSLGISACNNSVKLYSVGIGVETQTKNGTEIKQVEVMLTMEQAQAIQLMSQPEARSSQNIRTLASTNIDYSVGSVPSAEINERIDVANLQSAMEEISHAVDLDAFMLDYKLYIPGLDGLLIYAFYKIVVLSDGTIIIAVDEDEDGEWDYFIVIDKDGERHIFYDDPIGLFD